MAAPVRDLWFLDTLVKIRVPGDTGADGMSVLENRARFHDSPPLHVHTTEDELFIILDGELRFRVGADECTVGPGAVLLAPKNVPHTYRVDSPEGARWITVTVRGDFERFVRALSRPAGAGALPPPSDPPTQAAVQALASAARKFGIELVGPPMNS
jgi:mannose-6-phosphate isomerase-like protein (cupin superfamily)